MEKSNQDLILLIKNIPAGWQSGDLAEVFGKDSIAEIKVFSKERYGFITFTNYPELRKWVDMKQLMIRDAFLDLSKGEKNSCLYVQIKNPSITPEQINSSLDKNSVVYFDLSSSRNEIIIKFHFRAAAEHSKKILEDRFSDGINVSYADRDTLPIAIHLFFKKEQASKDIHAFNKIELEKSFNVLLQNEKSENGIDIDVDIDLPYEGKEYKGYGTLVFTASFKGISECERILQTQRGITVNGVYVRMSKHEYKKRQQNSTSSSSSSSSSSSFSSSSSSFSSSSSSSSFSSSLPSSFSSYIPVSSSFTSPIKPYKFDDGNRKGRENESTSMINSENDDADFLKENKRLISSSPNRNNDLHPHIADSPSRKPNSTSISPSPSSLAHVHTPLLPLSDSLISTPVSIYTSPNSTSDAVRRPTSGLSSLVSALQVLGNGRNVPVFVPKLKVNSSTPPASVCGEKKKELSLFFPVESVLFQKEMRVILGL